MFVFIPQIRIVLEKLGYAQNKGEVYVLAVGNRNLRIETNTNNLPFACHKFQAYLRWHTCGTFLENLSGVYSSPIKLSVITHHTEYFKHFCILVLLRHIRAVILPLAYLFSYR